MTDMEKELFLEGLRAPYYRAAKRLVEVELTQLLPKYDCQIDWQYSKQEKKFYFEVTLSRSGHPLENIINNLMRRIIQDRLELFLRTCSGTSACITHEEKGRLIRYEICLL